MKTGVPKTERRLGVKAEKLSSREMGEGEALASPGQQEDPQKGGSVWGSINGHQKYQPQSKRKVPSGFDLTW